ncbi:hypothetical protein FEM48_Zijuj08G0125200 [Ziziphus jujuba var. spinosa]|uniref:Uncharacterized protein n=1 Tax=Ziziphus jujuba var. spinosa TaxID=714518 RepID=A0A978UZ44_ZIZJJ|nr:hypothetical protein FEM48_Zijuj08G0125200 [Ziziphus jujuba var. spinosa]
MRMVAGKRYYGDKVMNEEEACQFRDIIKEMVSYAVSNIPGDFLPLFNWIGCNGSYESRIRNLGNRMDQFMQGLVDEHRKRKESENTTIDHLLSLQKSQPDYCYTDQIIKGLVLVSTLFKSVSL